MCVKNVTRVTQARDTQARNFLVMLALVGDIKFAKNARWKLRPRITQKMSRKLKSKNHLLLFPA